MIKNVFLDFNGTILDDLDLCIDLLNRMLNDQNKPLIPNEEHLYIYSFEVSNNNDIITLINIQLSQILPSSLNFSDLISLIRVGISGVEDNHSSLNGSLGIVKQKNNSQFTLLMENGNTYTFMSTDNLTINTYLEKVIF